MSKNDFDEKEQSKINKLVEEAEISDLEAADSELAIQERIGTQVGEHYQIIELIGEGGMSAVYKAIHTHLDTEVAIKILLPNLVRNKKTLMRFKQEAKAATQLNHPNICSVKEFGVDDEGGPYLVMDYVNGKSLEHYVETNGRLRVRRALEILEQIASGLNHAHSKGIIHRDIKPANIIIVQENDGSEGARIVDFGIAKFLREDDAGPNLTKTGDIFGTPNFMSPEQCLGKSVDTTSDVYSMGCILYYMLSGKPPFESESTLETLMKHVNEPIPYLDDVPDVANQMIAICTSKDIKHRYKNAGELGAKVDSTLNLALTVIENVYQDVLGTSELNDAQNSTSNQNAFNRTFVQIALLLSILGIAVTSLFFFNFVKVEKVATVKKPKRNTKEIVSMVKPQELVQNESKLSWKEMLKTADSFRGNGGHHEAMIMYKRSAGLAEQKNAPWGTLTEIYSKLAREASEIKNNKQAIEAYSKAATYANSAGDKKLSLKYLDLLAQCELKENQFGNAIGHYEEILKSQNKFANSPDLFYPWNALGEAYFKAGEFNNAKRSLKNIFRLAKVFPKKHRDIVAKAHWTFAKAEKESVNYQEAMIHFKKALSTGRSKGLSNSDIKQIEKELSGLAKLAH